NLLGLACSKYQIKQRGEVMEIWATDQLLPFQSYHGNQQPPVPPRTIEEQWSDMLKAKKLFPLLAILKSDPGPVRPGTASSPPTPERLRFEVKSLTPQKIEDPDGTLFQPPPDYHQIQPLQF